MIPLHSSSSSMELKSSSKAETPPEDLANLTISKPWATSRKSISAVVSPLFVWALTILHLQNPILFAEPVVIRCILGCLKAIPVFRWYCRSLTAKSSSLSKPKKFKEISGLCLPAFWTLTLVLIRTGASSPCPCSEGESNHGWHDQPGRLQLDHVSPSGSCQFLYASHNLLRTSLRQKPCVASDRASLLVKDSADV